jgi:anti-sigma regulatory factor (Ser/Thr protein kinase)
MEGRARSAFTGPRPAWSTGAMVKGAGFSWPQERSDWSPLALPCPAGTMRQGLGMVVLTVPAQLAFRGLAARTVAAVSKATRTPAESDAEHDRADNELVSAVGEAFNNIVIHGHHDGRTGEITITISRSDAGLTVELLDHGAAFEPDAIPEPDLSEGLESGMGLFIIRSFVDKVTYLPGTPNRLSLFKAYPVE